MASKVNLQCNNNKEKIQGMVSINSLQHTTATNRFTTVRVTNLQHHLSKQQTGWPDAAIKSCLIISERWPKWSFFKRVEFFHIVENDKIIGQLLIENLPPLPFKNRPIWSHWQQHKLKQQQRRQQYLEQRH